MSEIWDIPSPKNRGAQNDFFDDLVQFGTDHCDQGVISLAEKMTAGVAESSGSLPPDL